MDGRAERRAKVSAYVRERLRSETTERGSAARVARATKTTTAHIANVKNDRSGVGDDFARAIAGYWGMDLSQLEAEALKRPAPPARAKREPFPNHAVVMASPEFDHAHEVVKRTFLSARGETGDRTVVQWSLLLDDLIRLHAQGLDISTLGGPSKPIKSTR